MLRNYLNERGFQTINDLDELDRVELRMELEEKGMTSELEELDSIESTIESASSGITGALWKLLATAVAIGFGVAFVKTKKRWSRVKKELEYHKEKLSEALEYLETSEVDNEHRRFLIGLAKGRIDRYKDYSKDLKLIDIFTMDNLFLKHDSDMLIKKIELKY